MRHIQSIVLLALALGGTLVAAVAVCGCGRPQATIPPPPPPAAPNAAAQQPPVAMRAVMFPEKYSFSTFANRGIEGWKVARSSDGLSLTCEFRSTRGSETHYGGVGIPLPGFKAFALTVTFTRGASAVKSVFVTALGPKGEEVCRWGYGLKDRGGKLVDGRTYAWRFVPGAPVGNQFWAIKGTARGRGVVHLFFDVDDGQEVAFRVDKVQYEQ